MEQNPFGAFYNSLLQKFFERPLRPEQEELRRILQILVQEYRYDPARNQHLGRYAPFNADHYLPFRTVLIATV